MKTFALCLALAALAAPAAFAKPAPARNQAPSTLARTASAEAPLGKDGQDTRQFCSSQNPNIEYRDCVNAATRDPNAKVRMG
jgi:hypothetical protein